MTSALLSTRRTHPAHERTRIASVRPDRGEQVLRAIGLTWAAGAASVSVGRIASERLDGKDDPAAMRALLKIVTRAAQSPAMTDVDAWAGALALHQSVEALLDLLAEEDSVLAQLPASRYAFAGRGLVRVPVRISGSTLTATFRREGDPMRVGGLTLASLELAPLGVGVLSTTTNEMLESALPDELETIVREAVLGDTSRMLDSILFDDVPADGVRPAGLQAVGTVTPGTGSDAASIASDMRAALTRLHAAGYGNPTTTRWVVNSEVAASLAEQSDEMRMNGTFLKIEVVSGLSVPSDAIFLMDCRAVAIAMELPRFESGTEASIVEQDGTPFTGGVTGPVGTLDAGVPARSLFQSNSSSLRGTWPINWALAAPGAVQVITPQEVGP
ncbi:hypothetical protein [Variovorax sp. Sphag1AA]|uniref:hypothetical protein n=1 Tax=Variovorax sp. Sphag1AA TaxID=2587027 RepID=UPI00160E5401|nr:hypothetical protein [Variovorax sp. Sphag1AA]MBB3180083.1 hypothetical protein [Variovorax sp. Sphag1AA]